MKAIPCDYLYEKSNLFPFTYREVFRHILDNAPTVQVAASEIPEDDCQPRVATTRSTRSS